MGSQMKAMYRSLEKPEEFRRAGGFLWGVVIYGYIIGVNFSPRLLEKTV
jgi:hypothetical protein